MIPLRFAQVRKFLGALFAALLVALSASLIAAPAPPAARKSAPPKAKLNPAARLPKAAVKPEPKAPEPASPAVGGEFADAWPTDHPAAADLELRPEDARKAEALATFTQAVVAEDAAETEKSLTGYRRALELDPGYAELAVKVAYELARRNDISGGIQVLKDCIKAAPKEPLPLIYLSQLYSKYLKKSDLALKYAEQALALAPENFASFLANFELHLAASDQQKAEATLERAGKVTSVDPKYWVQVGDLYTRLYLKEDGTSAPAELSKMNAVFRKAAELSKDDSAILSKVGDYFVLSRQVKEAIPYYLKVLAAAPTEKDPPINNTREKLARAFLVTEQPEEAIETLEKMAKDNPLRFDTFELLGELYEKKGEIEKALHNYQHSLLLDQTQPQNFLRLTDMQLRMKQADKAVETMKQARARFPDVPQITVSLAITLRQAKHNTDAMTVFAEAHADAQARHEELLTSAFYFQYAAAAEQAGLTEKAADLLRQCISLDPNNAAEAYNFLGYMWADRGERLDEAYELIRKAIAAEPDNGAYLDSLGWVYFKKGEHEKALKELLRAVEHIKPEDPVVFDHLADTYHALGRTAEALGYWQKALSLSADDKKQADKIAEKLEAARQKMTSGAAPPAKLD